MVVLASECPKIVAMTSVDTSARYIHIQNDGTDEKMKNAIARKGRALAQYTRKQSG